GASSRRRSASPTPRRSWRGSRSRSSSASCRPWSKWLRRTTRPPSSRCRSTSCGLSSRPGAPARRRRLPGLLTDAARGARLPAARGADRAGARARLERVGEVPLPPYVRRAPTAADRERYQTVYARAPGAVAAPTAGLHLTRELLGAIAAAGVRVATLTLHVGPGTFLPVRSNDLEQHVMAPEPSDIPPPTVEAIGAARAEGGRVIAVGTTTVRALESASADGA